MDLLVFYASCMAVLIGVGAFIICQLIIHETKCRDDGKSFSEQFTRGVDAVRSVSFVDMGLGQESEDEARKRKRKHAADANYTQCARDKRRRQQSCATRRPTGRPTPASAPASASAYRSHSTTKSAGNVVAACANLRAFLQKK